MEKKSADAFRTISEVADWLGVPTHVLRFWESRFTQVKPVKRAGGRRYYRPSDMSLLGGIRRLLHEDGMTIRGVQKLLREEGVKHVLDLSPSLDSDVMRVEKVSNIVPLSQPNETAETDPVSGLTSDPASESGTESNVHQQRDLSAPIAEADVEAEAEADVEAEAEADGVSDTRISTQDGAQIDAQIRAQHEHVETQPPTEGALEGVFSSDTPAPISTPSSAPSSALSSTSTSSSTAPVNTSTPDSAIWENAVSENTASDTATPDLATTDLSHAANGYPEAEQAIQQVTEQAVEQAVEPVAAPPIPAPAHPPETTYHTDKYDDNTMDQEDTVGTDALMQPPVSQNDGHEIPPAPHAIQPSQPDSTFAQDAPSAGPLSGELIPAATDEEPLFVRATDILADTNIEPELETAQTTSAQDLLLDIPEDPKDTDGPLRLPVSVTLRQCRTSGHNAPIASLQALADRLIILRDQSVATAEIRT